MKMPSATKRLWISGALWICVLLATALLIPPPAVAQGVAATSTAATIAPPAAQKLDIPGVPNAGRVNEFLYRGAQPNATGLSELRKLGVSLVINLETRGESRNEREEVAALGMRYVDIPLSGWHPPQPDSVVKFLELLRANPTQKIFVHCRYGSDRTSVMMAVYRISQQGWTPDQALAEMHAFHFHLFWHPSMAKYVAQFPQLFATDPTFAQFRNGTRADPPSR